MMNPCKWSEQLDDYLDGALSSVEECALEEHLLSCTECRQIYENAEALKALISATAKPERLPDNAFFEKALAAGMVFLPGGIIPFCINYQFIPVQEFIGNINGFTQNSATVTAQVEDQGNHTKPL